MCDPEIFFRCYQCNEVKKAEPFAIDWTKIQWEEEGMNGYVFCSRDCHKIWFEENYADDYEFEYPENEFDGLGYEIYVC